MESFKQFLSENIEDTPVEEPNISRPLYYSNTVTYLNQFGRETVIEIALNGALSVLDLNSSVTKNVAAECINSSGRWLRGHGEPSMNYTRLHSRTLATANSNYRSLRIDEMSLFSCYSAGRLVAAVCIASGGNIEEGITSVNEAAAMSLGNAARALAYKQTDGSETSPELLSQIEEKNLKHLLSQGKLHASKLINKSHENDRFAAVKDILTNTPERDLTTILGMMEDEFDQQILVWVNRRFPEIKTWEELHDAIDSVPGLKHNLISVLRKLYL